MKKIIFPLVVLITFYNSVVAQKTTFGFTAGTSIANYHAELDGESDNGNSTIGITAGFFADIPFTGNFSFQTGLNFVQKGTKDEQTFGGVTEKVKLIVNSFELPMNFVYSVVSSAGKFSFGAGPSIAFALSGKAEYDDGTTSISQSLNFGNDDDDDLKSLDFGANILAAYEFKSGFLVAVNFNKGFSNLLPGGSSDGKLTSQYFGIKLGYKLKTKK